MGNTPSQQPFEGTTSEADEPAASESLPGRAIRAVHSFITKCKQKVSELWRFESGETDFADASTPDTDTGSKESAASPASRSESLLPGRKTPFTRPARDQMDNNDSDLTAEKRDGQLALYYPDHPDTVIQSDTWQRVER